MPLNPSGAISLGGPTAGQSIAVELGLSPTATISLNQTNVRTLAQVPSGTIIMPTNFWGKSNFRGTQRAIFGYGQAPGAVSMTNLVSNTGVVAADVTGVGTRRYNLAASTYGGDKGIFGYGANPNSLAFSISNLVSNTGVVATDGPGVGTARRFLTASTYGGDKALFVYGFAAVAPGTPYFQIRNLVSNAGVVASDTPAAGTARVSSAGTGYGGDKGIVAFGRTPNLTISNISNLISNTGVIASDTPGVGTARQDLAAAGYGGDKAIFGYGSVIIPPANVALTTLNLVSNTGVVASDTPGVGTARLELAAAGYGGDKAIFGYGTSVPNSPRHNITNLVSNTGVVSGDVPGVGTARRTLAAAGYSL
jgi:hypothetical protein